jgi:hypothetical protein
MTGDVAVWITGIGAAVSIAAFWRSGRVRVLDLRTELRKQAAELRLALKDLESTIPFAVESRERVTSVTGQTGALQGFRQEAETDAAEVKALQAKVAGIEPIPFLAGYDAIEQRVVIAHEVSIRVTMLREKYTLAAEVDAEVRKHRREEMLEQVRRTRK